MSNITRSGLLQMAVLGCHENNVRAQEDQHTIHNAVQIRKTNFGPIGIGFQADTGKIREIGVWAQSGYITNKGEIRVEYG